MKRDKFDMEGFKKELTAHILPFWISFMVDDENGGFYGRMDGHNRLIKDASKGAVLNARLLWTFSAAYRLLKTPVYLVNILLTRYMAGCIGSSIVREIL